MNRDDPLELTEKARALLRAHAPPPLEQGCQQRVLMRLERTLALPLTPPAAPSASPAAPPPTSAAPSVFGLKLTGALVVAVGLAVVGVARTGGLQKSSNVGALDTGSVAPSAINPSPELAGPPADASENSALRSPAPQLPEPSVRPRLAIPKGAAGAYSGSAMGSATGLASTSSPAGSTLAEERALLTAARSALAGGQGSAALGLLSTHAKRFPAGRLSEERESLTIQALASTGAVDSARHRLEALRKRSPQSIFLPALESTLGGSP